MRRIVEILMLNLPCVITSLFQFTWELITGSAVLFHYLCLQYCEGVKSVSLLGAWSSRYTEIFALYLLTCVNLILRFLCGFWSPAVCGFPTCGFPITATAKKCGSTLGVGNFLGGQPPDPCGSLRSDTFVCHRMSPAELYQLLAAPSDVAKRDQTRIFVMCQRIPGMPWQGISSDDLLTSASGLSNRLVD
jgi:hypothetical protein